MKFTSSLFLTLSSMIFAYDGCLLTDQLGTVPAYFQSANFPKFVSDTLQRYEGTYELAPGQQLTVSLSDGKLYLLPPGETAKAQLEWVKDLEFNVVGEQAQVVFSQDNTGKILQVEIRFGNGRSTIAKKV